MEVNIMCSLTEDDFEKMLGTSDRFDLLKLNKGGVEASVVSGYSHGKKMPGRYIQADVDAKGLSEMGQVEYRTFVNDLFARIRDDEELGQLKLTVEMTADTSMIRMGYTSVDQIGLIRANVIDHSVNIVLFQHRPDDETIETMYEKLWMCAMLLGHTLSAVTDHIKSANIGISSDSQLEISMVGQHADESRTIKGAIRDGNVPMALSIEQVEMVAMAERSLSWDIGIREALGQHFREINQLAYRNTAVDDILEGLRMLKDGEEKEAAQRKLSRAVYVLGLSVAFTDRALSEPVSNLLWVLSKTVSVNDNTTQRIGGILERAKELEAMYPRRDIRSRVRAHH